MSFTLRHWPRALLQEAQMLWEIQGAAVSTGQTASGVIPMTNLSGGGLWKATLSEVGLFDANRRRTWRAIAAFMDNGAAPIVAPVSENVDAPWPVVGGVQLTAYDQITNSDNSLFSDDTGYENGIIEIKTVGAVSLRATSMTVDIVGGSTLQGGEYFSIDHPGLRWRLYRIATAIDNGDGTANVTFRPPLRAAVADGTWLEFDHPKCVMRLASTDAMDVTMENLFYSKPNVSFVEAFPPFPA